MIQRVNMVSYKLYITFLVESNLRMELNVDVMLALI